MKTLIKLWGKKTIMPDVSGMRVIRIICLIGIFMMMNIFSDGVHTLQAQTIRTQGPLISTFSSGGIVVTPPGSVRLRGVIGQPLIGRYSSGAVQSGAGFFQAAAGITTAVQQTNSLTLAPATVSMVAAGGTASVNVTSNVSWTASDDQPWLTVSPSSGSNNGTLTLTATQNTGTTSRSAVLTVVGGGITQTATITQDAPIITPTLSVSPSSVSIGASGGTSNVNVSSNSGWVAASNQSWLTVTPSSGSNNGTLTLSASANTGTTARTAVITVAVNATVQQTVNVTQEAPSGGGGSSITLTLPTLTAPQGAITIPVNVSNVTGLNVDSYNVQITYDPNILTISGANVTGTLSASGAPTVNTGVAGRVTVSWFAAGAISGSGVLFNLTGTVNAGSGTSALTVASARLGNITPTNVNGSVTVSQLLCGDANNDRTVDIRDAALVARFDAGLTTLTSAQQQAGNVNGDSFCDIRDAALIARFDAGLIAANPPFPNGCRPVSIAGIMGDVVGKATSGVSQTAVTLTLPSGNILADRDGNITIPIRVSNMANVNATSWSLGFRYDSTSMRLTDIVADGSTVTPSGGSLTVNANLPNEIRGSWFTSNTTGVRTDGVIAVVRGRALRNGAQTFSVSRSIIGDASVTVAGGGITTGVSSRLAQSTKLRVVPNPMEAISQIEFSNEREQVVRVEVVNTLGIVVAEIANRMMKSGDQSYSMPQNLSSGMYYVRVHIGSETAVVPVVVAR